MSDHVRLVMTLLVRDEIDIVGSVLDAHFALGVDHVIATDNGSVDGTTAVLERYERQGGLTLLREPADDYSQSAWVTRMARLAATKLKADWVINADADEIWMPASGDLRSAFESVPADVDLVVAYRHNFVLRPEDGRPFLERMRWRRADSLTHDGVPMGRKVAHRASAEVVVAMGNHSVDGLEGGSIEDARIEILHFPLRSLSQYRHKIAVGTAALERNVGFDETIGWHWRRSARLLRDGELDEAWESWLHDDDRLANDLRIGVVVADSRFRDLVAAGHPQPQGFGLP